MLCIGGVLLPAGSPARSHQEGYIAFFLFHTSRLYLCSQVLADPKLMQELMKSVDVALSRTGHNGLDIGQTYDQDTGRYRSDRGTAAWQAKAFHGRREAPPGGGSSGSRFQR